jgi:hypothetical protein
MIQMPQIESVQIALFIREQLPSADEVAKQVFNRELLQFARVNPVITVAMVQLDDLIVQIQVSPGRIDFVVGSSPAGSLVGIHQAIDLLREPLIGSNFAKLAWRIALIVNAFDIATSFENAIEMGRVQLTEAILPQNGADFEVKINIPAQSVVQHGLRINRLYQLRPLGVMEMIVAADINQPVMSTSQTPTQMRLMHQTDVNTDGESDIEPQNFGLLLNELTSMTKFLIENGFQGLKQ